MPRECAALEASARGLGTSVATVATYLSQAHEGRESYADVFYCWVRDRMGRQHYAETPQWGQRFVFAVDRAAPSRPITAQEALALLERAEHPPVGARSHEGP